MNLKGLIKNVKKTADDIGVSKETIYKWISEENRSPIDKVIDLSNSIAVSYTHLTLPTKRIV